MLWLLLGGSIAFAPLPIRKLAVGSPTDSNLRPVIGDDWLSTVIYVLYSLVYNGGRCYYTWSFVVVSTRTANNHPRRRLALWQLYGCAVLIVVDHCLLFFIPGHHGTDRATILAVMHFVGKALVILCNWLIEFTYIRSVVRQLKKSWAPTENMPEAQSTQLTAIADHLSRHTRLATVITLTLVCLNLLIGLWPFFRQLAAYHVPIQILLAVNGVLFFVHGLPTASGGSRH